MLDSSPIWRQLLLQAALILLNAFFAATEIAVLSLNENKVRKQSEEGDKRAAKLLKIIEQPTTFLSKMCIRDRPMSMPTEKSGLNCCTTAKFRGQKLT